MTESATILLVEDDQSLLYGIADLLEVADLGYEMTVLTAADGRAGLEKMAERSPDLIVSDITMPHMDGLEFLKQVRANPNWVQIPFIFLTARGEKKDIHKGLLTGAELYITKPFDNVELLTLVKSQLDRAFQLRQVRSEYLRELKKNILQLLNHEFRTPLTYVTAYYEMLADSLNLEESQNLQEYLHGILAGCVRLSQLVDDLVAVMDLRTGEARSLFEKRVRLIDNVAELLYEAGAAYKEEAAAQGIQIQIDKETHTLPPILGDPDFLLKLFKQLVDNAVKFTAAGKREKGTITLQARLVDQELCLSVKDNGIGFPEHARERLFDPLFQYNRDLLEQQGSGSGLAIAKGLVELHGGRIEAISQEGEGAEFLVFLPAQTRPAQNVAESLANIRPARRVSILAVEDDPYLLDGLQELLEIYEGKYTFRVFTALNAIKALEILRKVQPDLIISDIMMPQMDGYEFLAEVRRNPKWLHIPFIFLSAKGTRHDILRGQRSGAEQYITKPYDSDELLELVISQLDRYFQVQQIVHQDFDKLKRGILGLLQPDFHLPLTSVTDYSQQLAQGLEQAQTDEDMKESLVGLQSATSHLTRLVEDFISLAELRTGEALSAYRMRARPINLNSLVNEAVYLQADNLAEANLQAEIVAGAEVPSVVADEESLLMGLQRLLEVATWLCQKSAGGRFFIHSGAAADEVFLSLTFRDAVYDEEALRQVKKFLETQEYTFLDMSRWGPGLAIVSGIIELHGGRLVIESKDESENARDCRLNVYLPIENDI